MLLACRFLSSINMIFKHLQAHHTHTTHKHIHTHTHTQTHIHTHTTHTHTHTHKHIHTHTPHTQTHTHTQTHIHTHTHTHTHTRSVARGSVGVSICCVWASAQVWRGLKVSVCSWVPSSAQIWYVLAVSLLSLNQWVLCSNLTGEGLCAKVRLSSWTAKMHCSPPNFILTVWPMTSESQIICSCDRLCIPVRLCAVKDSDDLKDDSARLRSRESNWNFSLWKQTQASLHRSSSPELYFHLQQTREVWRHLFFQRFIYCMYTSILSLSSDTPKEDIRSRYRWLWATMLLLGFELRTPGRAVRALNHWAISPAPEDSIKHTNPLLKSHETYKNIFMKGSNS